MRVASWTWPVLAQQFIDMLPDINQTITSPEQSSTLTIMLPGHFKSNFYFATLHQDHHSTQFITLLLKRLPGSSTRSGDRILIARKNHEPKPQQTSAVVDLLVGGSDLSILKLSPTQPPFRGWNVYMETSHLRPPTPAFFRSTAVVVLTFHPNHTFWTQCRRS